MTGLLRASLLLGAGLGGLFDGIVFHQILQWHHMVSGIRPPVSLRDLELNTLFDGLFHGAGWVVAIVGIWLVQRADRSGGVSAGRVLAGGVLAGWGAFNVVEGLVDHYMLGVHHVRPGPEEVLYDLAFLAWGVAFLAIGVMNVRAARDGVERPAWR